MAGNPLSTIVLSKSKSRLQQVFGDRLKLEEKLQVLEALVSTSEQEPHSNRGIKGTIQLEQTNNQEKQKTLQDQSQFVCAVCGKRFQVLNQYHGHLQKHRGENFSWICYKCPKEAPNYKSLSSLRKHEKSFHQTSYSYKCKYCKETFSCNVLKEDHQNHMHSESARFSCQLCDKSFYKKSDLRTHLATHLSLQGSVCEVCGRSFSHISNLIRHSYLHSGVKPYPCKLCGKRFIQLSSLKQHKMSHHDNLSIPCPALPQQCAKVFKTPVLARQHAFRVHPGILWENSVPVATQQKQKRSYYCRDCGDAFQCAKDLKIHCLSHHRGNNDSSKEDLLSGRDISYSISTNFLLSSALDSEEQVNNLADDLTLNELGGIECPSENLLASMDIDCGRALTNGLKPCPDSSVIALENQTVLLSAAVCPELYNVIEGEPPKAFLLKDHENQLAQLEFFDLESVEGNDPLIEFSYLDIETDRNTNELAQLEDFSVQIKRIENQDSRTQTQGENEHNCQSTDPPIGDETGCYPNVSPELAKLDCQDIVQLECHLADLNNELSGLQDLNLHDSTCPDLKETDLHSLHNSNDFLKNQLTDHKSTNAQSSSNHTLSSSGLSSLLTTVGHENDHIDTNLSESHVISTELPDEITYLLPETNPRSGNLAICVSQVDGSTTEVKSTMEFVVSDSKIITVQDSWVNPKNSNISALVCKAKTAASQGPTTDIYGSNNSSSVPLSTEFSITQNSVAADISTRNSLSNPSQYSLNEPIQEEPSCMSNNLKKKKPNRTKKQCTECGKVFFKSSNLKQHLGTHFPVMQSYECDICNQLFAWKSTLNKHKISIHEVVLKQFLCDLCGKQYNTITQVKEHKRRDHQSLRPNTCNICNKSFFRKYDLSIHLRIHSNQKPFMCGICGKTFNHLSHVKRHEKVHGQGYKFATCGNLFTLESNLNVHCK